MWTNAGKNLPILSGNHWSRDDDDGAVLGNTQRPSTQELPSLMLVALVHDAPDVRELL